ncbi:dihydrofolate reductase [Paenibacillus sp. PDC88]|uniref:dihydrofolate reductase n=1 Tax=Paenibacillus sp. PDC88 TaxID=1884375 RepID=UPI000894F89D|nr:dihydrofolate reductase [Paenibacillus sp. PDC88]SDW62718.1 dihydrofolate reductase [Paenibacillus sp. PDC88]
MGITMIWAMSANGVIGRDNGMPWRLPKDMDFFKAQTTGHTIIMGRKTWESLRGRALPNRRNVVLTRQALVLPGAEVIHSVMEGVELAKEEELFVIGGAKVYEEFLPYADQLIVTRIRETIDGDTYMPDINWDEWDLMEEIQGEKDEKNPYEFSFQFYRKIV